MFTEVTFTEEILNGKLHFLCSALRATPEFFVKLKISWIYIIVTNFVSTAFMVVELNIFKVLRTN